MAPAWLFALILVACACEATLVLGTLVPGEIVLVLAAGTVGAHQLPLVVAAAAVGTFVGQYAGYQLGVRYGGRIRFSRIGRRIGPHRWRRGELVLRNATATTMVAVRFVAFGHTLAPVVAGALRMERGRFLWLTAVASAAWAVVWVGVGLGAGSLGMSADDPVPAVVLAVTGVVVATLTLARLTRRVGQDDTAGEPAEHSPSGEGVTSENDAASTRRAQRGESFAVGPRATGRGPSALRSPPARPAWSAVGRTPRARLVFHVKRRRLTRVG